MDIAEFVGLERPHLAEHIIVMRVGIAAALGAAIGFERGAGNSTAGLRTHILIAVAATLFTLIALEIYHLAQANGNSGSDPVRAIEAITAGIAFLGAGAIFQRRGSVRGLTTGAGMWLSGAVGMSVALGYYVIAGFVALLAVIVLAAMRAFSHQVVGEDDFSGDA